MNNIYNFEEGKEFHNSGCQIGINDLGITQCRECRALFSWNRDKKVIKRLLAQQYGEDFAEKEYQKLVEIRRLIRRYKFSELVSIVCTYSKENGKIRTTRRFYDKR
jgi:hypothetical protein